MAICKAPISPISLFLQMFHPTLTTGILPMGALIYMNTKIYMGKSNCIVLTLHQLVLY